MRAVAAFGMLALPTSLMGLTFPLLLQRVARSPRVGQHVGRLTAINTLGAVSGALITGYVVLALARLAARARRASRSRSRPPALAAQSFSAEARKNAVLGVGGQRPP